MADGLLSMADQASNPPPFKKRRFYRRRPQSEDDDGNSDDISVPYTANATESVPLEKLISQGSSNADVDVAGEQRQSLSVSEILRQRKAMLRKKGGIEFRNDSTASKIDSLESQAGNSLLDEDETLNRIITVVDRFAPQTGQVADVDQHMYATPHFLLLNR